MLSWPHAGFHVHTAVWVPEDDRALATRLARYGARNPVALARLTYDRAANVVTYRSDKSDGPTAGTETADALEFLARVLVHIPDKGHVTTRYYGWYANRPGACGGRPSPPSPRRRPPSSPRHDSRHDSRPPRPAAGGRRAPADLRGGSAREPRRVTPPARPPTPRPPPAYGPRRPAPTRGRRRARPSPRGVTAVPAGPSPDVSPSEWPTRGARPADGTLTPARRRSRGQDRGLYSTHPK